MLATANLWLHKIASNNPHVTHAFPVKDQAMGLCSLDISHADKSAFKQTIQRSLIVSWDLNTDSFKFKVSIGDKPFFP